MKELPQVQIACSLDGAEAAQRGGDIGELARDALISRSRTNEGLQFVFAKEAEERVRWLVAAESQCCPFLSFEIASKEETVRLEIRGPRDAGPVLDSLFAAAAPA
jgi:hypothetical protein